MDMKSLLEKMSQLSQVDEETNKKPDEDGDGVPDWADKKPSKDDSEEEDKVDEAISIQADGQEAMSLLDILKLAGQPVPQSSCGCGGDVAVAPEVAGMEVAEEEEDPVYTNTPDEVVQTPDAATPSGNDLHKEKNQYKHSYRQGDNPMAMEEIAKIEGKLTKMFETISKSK